MAYFNGKEGRWITTETGRHVFIPDGEDPAEVMKDLFDDEIADDNAAEPPFDEDTKVTDSPDVEINTKGKVIGEEEPEIQDREFKENNLKSFRGIWDAPYSSIKNYWKKP